MFMRTFVRVMVNLVLMVRVMVTGFTVIWKGEVKREVKIRFKEFAVHAPGNANRKLFICMNLFYELECNHPTSP